MRWRSKRVGIRSDGIAGTPSKGYWQVEIDGVLYRAHAIAWALMTGEWPPDDKYIDHKDGDGTNNRWENLRLATHAENLWNSRRSKNNKSGTKGVYWDPRKQKWKTQICRMRVRYDLGHYDTVEEAGRAYERAARELFGEYANTGRTI